MAKKTSLIVAATALAICVGVFSMVFKKANDESVQQASVCKLEEVKLLTGSAKFEYLSDPEMVSELEKNCIKLSLVKTSSFESDVAQKANFDAVFPAGESAANDFAKAWKSQKTYSVFSTPLAFATWKDISVLLKKNNIINADNLLDLEALTKTVYAKKKWIDLEGNTSFKSNKSILVATPDVRESTTGLNFLAALAYVANGREPLTSDEMATKYATDLSYMLTRQGFQEKTLSGPFENYLHQGKGSAPLVLVYESQFLTAKANKQTNDNMLLVYSTPAIILKHIVVATNAKGERLGEFLSQNKVAQNIAIKYGFRSFAANASLNKSDFPELIDVAELPTSSALTAMQTVVSANLSK